jgi:nucleotide-binding universal stress UspA family protein
LYLENYKENEKDTKMSLPRFNLEPIEKIVIALDYNPTAQKVAEKGYSLARAMNAEVILLHVIVDEVYYSSLEYSPIMGNSTFARLKLNPMIDSDGLKNAAQAFLDQTKQHLGDEKIQTLVKEGDFAEAISEAAKDFQADLIVMGSHSQRWLEKILMGSVTEKVLNNTTIPLFIIPTKKT